MTEIVKPEWDLREVIYVFCQKCNEFRSEEYVETLGIQEDFQGRDLLSFICDRCETRQEAYRVAR